MHPHPITPTRTTPTSTPQSGMSARRRRSAAPRWLCAIAATTATAALMAAPAYAGTWVQVSCVNPDGSAAPSEGWSNYAGGGTGVGSTSSSQCSPGNPMFAFLSTTVGAPTGAGETLQYAPPAGSTLIGGTAQVQMSADGYGLGASGTAVAYSPNPAYDAGDVFYQCAYDIASCGTGGYDFTGQLNLPTDRGGGFYLSAGCGGTTGQYCNSGGSAGTWSAVRLSSADFDLSNTSTPAASPIIGTLLNANARGTQDVTFTASDPGGPGVYEVTSTIDGTSAYSGTPDTNAGACATVGTQAGALMFDHQQPCKQTENVDLSIDTTPFTDGTHTLKITLTDAAQNTSVVYDSTITTLNAPTNSQAPAIANPNAALFVGAQLAANVGAWSAPTGAGSVSYSYQWEDCDAQGSNCSAIAGANAATYGAAPSDIGDTLRVAVTATDSDGNETAASAPTESVQSASGTLGAAPGPGGSPPSSSTPPSGSSGPPASPGAQPTAPIPNGTVASAHAVMRLGLRRVISRSFADRAFTLKGRLLDATGTPIAGATLDVLAQTLGGRGALKVILHTRTAKGGAFSVRVPAGPSRLVEVAYRAFNSETTYATVATVQEEVAAGVALAVAPTRTTPSGTIILTGRVEGQVPPTGVVVELLVHYLGHWEPFRTTRTGRSGAFRVAYRFEGGRGLFPFRARIRADQAGFPYTLGQSQARNVTTH
jgi:hypothetical protein